MLFCITWFERNTKFKLILWDLNSSDVQILCLEFGISSYILISRQHLSQKCQNLSLFLFLYIPWIASFFFKYKFFQTLLYNIVIHLEFKFFDELIFKKCFQLKDKFNNISEKYFLIKPLKKNFYRSMIYDLFFKIFFFLI